MNQASARAALRSATASHHHRVDKLFSHANLRDRAGLANFLVAQARAYVPVERALEIAGVAEIVPDWTASRRSPKLTADLSTLGLSPPEETPWPLAFDGVPAILGGAYVLEGSRLGGALLRRFIPPGLIVTFLEPVDSAAWQRFLALLEENLKGTAEIEAAVASACSVFSVFEQCGQLLVASHDHE